MNKIISNLNLKNVNWIASHPIAGTEFSGPEAGSAELFLNRWCILSAEEKIPEDKIKILENTPSRVGASGARPFGCRLSCGGWDNVMLLRLSIFTTLRLFWG